MITSSTTKRCCVISNLFIRHLWRVLFLLAVPFFANSQVIDLGQINRNTADVRYDNPFYSSPDIQKELTRSQLNSLSSNFFYSKYQFLGQKNAVTNPDLPLDISCQGLRVVFILDESGSIMGDDAVEVRTGALALANALNNSGAELRVIEFATSASVINLGGASVNNTFISNFNNYLNSSYLGQSYNPVSQAPCNGWTNWEDALIKAQPLPADLIIFFTDGNPTAYNQGSSNTCGSVRTPNDGTYSASTALSRAVTVANAIKTSGKHMFAVGVGSSINESNLIAVSGPDKFNDNHNIYTDDYAIGDFDIIASTLTAAVNLICGTTLEIEKFVNESSKCVGQSVTFTIKVKNTGGQYGFDANNVVITDVLPNGYTNPQIVGNVPGASFNGNTLTYNAGNLPANEFVTISFTATLTTPPANYNNIAKTIADNANEVSDNAIVNAIYPDQPTLACYQTAVFNSQTCEWDVTGEQPAQPTLACYESAVFNTQTCEWDVTGEQPAQPTLACYESAEFNTQ
ncbi:MAG: VWA domain-containing protein, partial [Flavobacteriales bacterium]